MIALSKQKMLFGAVAVTALLVVAGCSALRIDVDVYKGPLANGEEVQVRQYSALAIAAKPLLAELRNKLEENEEKFKKFINNKENRRYLDAWIPESKESYFFKNSQARFVNGALSAYEDAGDPQTASAVLKAKDAWIATKRQLSILEISKDIDQPLAAETRSKNCDDSPVCIGIKDEASRRLWMNFRNAYAQFLNRTEAAELKSIRTETETVELSTIVSQRFVTTLQLTCNLLQKIISSDAGRRDKRFADAFCSSGQSANEHYAAIGRREAVEIHSQILFGRTNERFVGRVLEISSAYLESRAQLRKLWLASVDIVDALGDGRGEAQGPGGALAAGAYLLANVTQPRSLACALSSSAGKEIEISNPLRAELKAGDSGIFPEPGKPVAWSQWGNPAIQIKQYDRANIAMQAAIKAFPREMARMLRAADRRFATPIDLQQGDCTALSENDRIELKDGQARQYGLVRGPTLDPSSGFERVIAALDDALTDIQRGTAAGFERARLTKGIETLTKSFFDTLNAEGHDHNREPVRMAREELDEALILFAERILFVTNNRSLIEVVRSDPELARATAVLQTVGNSLIVHVNDLRERSAHGRRLMRRADSERAAMNLAFELAPTQTLENVAREIRANLERLALEQERLNLEKDRRTRAGGLDAQALTALQDQAKTAAVKVEKALAAKNAAAERVRLAYYALALVDPKLTIPPEMPSLSNEVADRASLGKQLEKVGTAATQNGLLDSMRDWINANIIKVGVSETARNQLFAAKAYLSDKDAALAEQDTVKKNLKPFVVFATKIGDDYSDKLKKFRAESASFLQDKSNADTIKKQADSAAGRSPASLRAVAADAEIGVSDLRGALEIIRSVQEAVLERAKQGKISEPAAVLELFKTETATRIESKHGGASDVKKYSALQKAIANTSPPPSLSSQSLGSVSATPKPNQRDVLDDVIAVLRQQRLQATATSDSGRAASIEKALALAYEQRAGMAYLRPASAYLRSAYTATALQSGADAGWVNLLRRSSGQALFGQKPDEFETAKQDIDKQFWQNVNTVNVSGGGATNYVLVKDDVGNWYLKAYEADSEAVFRSAKNLLLFNTGRSINLDLLQRAELQRRANSTTDPTERTRLEEQLSGMTAGRSGAAGTGALQSVKGRYEKDYAARTTQDATELRDKLKDVGNQIKVAWEGQLQSKSKPALIASLSATYLPDGPQEAAQARVNIEKALTDGTSESAASKATDSVSDAIIDALRMMQRSRRRLYLDIARNDNVLPELAVSVKAKNAYDKAIADRKDAKVALDNSPETAREKNAANLKAREEHEGVTQKAHKDAEEEYNSARSDRLIAARVAASVIGNLIAPTVARRMDTVRQYETAISFVGEVAGAK